MQPARVARGLAWLTVALVVADVVVASHAVSLTSETAIAVHGFPLSTGQSSARPSWAR